MKTLVFLTSQFPFGKGESFIESEYPFLKKSFEKIIIIAQNTTYIQTREVSPDTVVYRYNPSTSITGFLYLPFLFLLNFQTINKLFREEINFRKTIDSPLTTKKLLILFKRIIKAVQLRTFIENILSKENIDNSVVFYSYWLKTAAQAIAMIKYEKSIKIARAHGSDLYEEKTISQYLPLLNFTAMNLDALFFTSKDGKEYFEHKINGEKPSFLVSYLGIRKPEINCITLRNTDDFRIVSCSNMIPLKRIDLIINALAEVKSLKKIEWIHFGDGMLKKDLEMLALEKLQDHERIGFRFMGNYPNADLLEYYSRNTIDLFINTSSTEGIPVSIMEAQCFGIPVIATDTGGVKEVVVKGTGSLLPVNFKPLELTALIEYYAILPEMDFNNLRINARNNWNSNFNAASNFGDFIKKVSSLGLETGQ